MDVSIHDLHLSLGLLLKENVGNMRSRLLWTVEKDHALFASLDQALLIHAFVKLGVGLLIDDGG